MNVFQSCTDTTDVTPLCPSQGLYLKPAARINISVHLPTLKLPGKTISNWEVMEKLRHWASPEEFIVLKVSKSTLEFIRFEGEIENRSKLSAVLARLDGRSIKLSGFPDPLKVRAAEAKPDFPSRYSWDSYFRDAKNMNEMKPGERPDTIHFTNLPCKWFSSKPDGSKPSEHSFRRVFETFGEVRCIDIPMLDPYRNQMKSHISGVKMFSHNQNMIFEAYVQYKEYFCFVKAMDALRGMKLVYKGSDGRTFSASIKVDFDKTKHLSDSSIRRRRVERDRLIVKEREREDYERQAAEQEQAKKEAERRRKQEEKEAKLERRRKREEKRKAKELAKLKQQEAEEMNKKIATEERLLLMAQRRLESIRLLGELFNRIKDTKVKQLKSEDSRNMKSRGKDDSKRNAEEDLMNKEQELRDKLVRKFKMAQEHKVSKQSKKLQRTIEGKNKLRSVLASNNAVALSDMSEDETSSQSSLDKSITNDVTEGTSDWKDEKRFVEGDQDPQIYRGRYQRSGRGLHFGGRGHYPPISYQFPQGGNYFAYRRGYRWPRYSNRGRGGGYMQPFIDPVYLDINHQYYKYFHKLAYGDRGRSYSKSSSRSHSRSHSRSSYSRSYSRSYTRSRSRSRSRRRRRSRSRSVSRRRGRSRNSRSRSRSYSKRRSRKYSSSHHRSKSASNSASKDKQGQKEVIADSNKDNSLPKALADQLEPVKSPERFPSIEHTWSRSPSRSRSISWEKRSNDSRSDSKRSKHKKSKHKKKKKKRSKDSQDSR